MGIIINGKAAVIQSAETIINTQQIVRSKEGYEYDENGNPIFENVKTKEGNNMTHSSKPIRYINSNGITITQEEYESKVNTEGSVYIAQFIGCTYHCG